MKKTLVLTVHADPSVKARYVDTLVEAGHKPDEIVVHMMVAPPLKGVPGGGLSSRYDALAQVCLQLGKGSAIRGLCQQQKIKLEDYDRVFLATFSAGYAFARHLSPADTDMLEGLVLIDSGHTSKDKDGSPSDAGIAWLVEWAFLARAGKKTLAIGHTDVDPVTYASTTQVAEEAIRLSGPPIEDAPLGTFEAEHGCKRIRLESRMLVAAFDRRKPADAKLEHGDALTVWGDELVAWAVSPPAFQVGEAVADAGKRIGDVVVNAVGELVWPSLGERIVQQVLFELGDPPREIPGPKYEPRIVAYGKACRRGGLFQGVNEQREPLWVTDRGKAPSLVSSATDEEHWCCKARSAAVLGALEPGDVPPHGLRVAVWEAVEDAGGSLLVPFAGTGCWVEPGPDVEPHPGWAAIFARAGGNPRRRGPGHITTVLGGVDLVAGTFESAGGNENNTYQRGVRKLADVVGWIATEPRKADSAAA